MKFKFSVTLFCSLLVVGPSVQAQLKSVTLRWEDKVSTNRWLFEEKPKIMDRGLPVDLYNVKKAEFDKNFEKCYNLVRKADVKGSPIRRWLQLQRLSCAISHYKLKKKGTDYLQDSFMTVVRDRELMSPGNHLNRLRDKWSEAGILLFDAQMRSRSKQAWKTYDALEEFAFYMSRNERAEMYRLAGEISFYEQNLSSAVYFYNRSLSEENRESVQARLKVIRGEYLRSLKKPIPPDVITTVDDSLSASAEELKLDRRMKDSAQSNDLVAVVEDGVQLLRDFSGGVRAQAAHKQILNIYLNLANKKDEKFVALRKRVVAQMARIDGARLYDWATVMVAREYYEDAIALSESSIEKLGGQPLSTAVLLLASTSALHSANFSLAQKYFEKLIQAHAGTEASYEATFRLGLLQFRQGNYAESSTLFEKFLTNRQSQSTYSEFDIPAMYWMWRGQQFLKNPRADEVAKELMRRYPLSYYALKARYELGGQKLAFDKKVIGPKVKAEVFMAPHEFEAWERFLILARAGWMSEAQAELDLVPSPADGEGKLIWARVWASVLGYNKAFELLTSAWQEDPTLIHEEALRIAYPKEFLSLVEAESKRTKLPTLLVLSLIRQESTFRFDVTSPANAMGLMQVVPTTAKEIAGDLRLKTYTMSQDLFIPAVNVRIGTAYLARLLRNFDGHVPLALAAYNAGIGNVKGWLATRTDLKDIRLAKSSETQAEIWFDELPWSETSGYIKSILRNYLIYRYLDQGDVVWKDPVWQN
jgi:soluble lytic murein transglycosylase